MLSVWGTSVVVEQVGQITFAVVVVVLDDDDGVSPAGSELCNINNIRREYHQNNHITPVLPRGGGISLATSALLPLSLSLSLSLFVFCWSQLTLFSAVLCFAMKETGSKEVKVVAQAEQTLWPQESMTGL